MDQYLKVFTAIVLAYVVYTLVSQNKQTPITETFTNVLGEPKEEMEEEMEEEAVVAEVTGYTGDSNALELNKPTESSINLGSCGGKSQFISTNLLPKRGPQNDR